MQFPSVQLDDLLDHAGGVGKEPDVYPHVGWPHSNPLLDRAKRTRGEIDCAAIASLADDRHLERCVFPGIVKRTEKKRTELSDTQSRGEERLEKRAIARTPGTLNQGGDLLFWQKAYFVCLLIYHRDHTAHLNAHGSTNRRYTSIWRGVCAGRALRAR